MNAEELAKRLFEVARHWPAGMVVWHRACGKRGVVVEYVIAGDGIVSLVVSYGAGQNWEKCRVLELSAWTGADGEKGACKDPVDCTHYFLRDEPRFVRLRRVVSEEETWGGYGS